MKSLDVRRSDANVKYMIPQLHINVYDEITTMDFTGIFVLVQKSLSQVNSIILQTVIGKIVLNL